MNANHGGGYSYRLCKIPEEGPSGLTEECFQRTPLFFASNEQWVQTGYDTETRIYFTANRTTKGTYPPGKNINLNWHEGVRDSFFLCVFLNLNSQLNFNHNFSSMFWVKAGISHHFLIC